MNCFICRKAIREKKDHSKYLSFHMRILSIENLKLSEYKRAQSLGQVLVCHGCYRERKKD